MASPSVVGTPTETAISTAGTSHVVNLPSGATGNLMIAIMDKGSTAATVNSLTGWNELLDENSANGLYIAWRTCDGTEGATTTFTLSASTRGAWIVYEISGHINPATQPPQIGTTSSGSSTAPDPPSVSVTGGSKDILTIACFGRGGEEADDDTWVSAAPGGFGGLLQKACGTVGTNLGGMVATAHLAETTATANPGAFTCATGAWRAQTIVVHPVVPTQTSVARISLAAGSTPTSATAHSIKVRARTTAGAGTIRAALYEGASNRSGDLESSALTTSLADYTLSIPDASAANITDYSDLEIRLWGYAAGAGSIVFEVDQLWLEIPEGTSGNTYTKTGAGISGLVGAGASASLTQETGRGVAGTVGAGASASLTQETGRGVSGTVGAGTSASLTQESGAGIAGLVGAGVRARDRARTGAGVAGLVGSGESASLVQETGFATVGGVGSGASQFVLGAGNVYAKAGFASVGEVGAGADVDVAVEAGRAVAGLVGSGSDVDVAAETGAGIAGLVGAGAGASVFQESGAGIAGLTATGSRAAEHVRANAGVVGLVGTGADVDIAAEAGAGKVGAAGSGADATVDVESGAGVVGAVGAGVASKAGQIVKTGFGSVGTVGAGRDSYLDTETGAVVAGTVGAGFAAHVYVERGFGKVGTVGSGSTSSFRVYTKAGFATAAGVGAGNRTTEHPRSGHGVVGTTASGTAHRELQVSGYGKVGANGYGTANWELLRSGFGQVGTKGSGDALIEVFFTLLDPIYTGHVAMGATGISDGRENGHVSDTVGGVIVENHEEVPA